MAGRSDDGPTLYSEQRKVVMGSPYTFDGLTPYINTRKLDDATRGVLMHHHSRFLGRVADHCAQATITDAKSAGELLAIARKVIETADLAKSICLEMVEEVEAALGLSEPKAPAPSGPRKAVPSK